MKRRLIILGLAIIGVLLLCTPVSAESQGLPLCWNIPFPLIPGIDNLKAMVGSSWILWTWNYTNNTPNTTVFVDGKFAIDTIFDHYALYNLSPREEHRIELAEVGNTTNLFGSSSVKTLYSYGIYYILFLLTVALFVIEILFSKVKELCILFGLFCFMFGIASLYFSYIFYLSMLSYIIIGMMSISVIWILGALFTLIIERRSYE